MEFAKEEWYSIGKEGAGSYNVGLTGLGISTPPFEKQTRALRARIHEGVSNIELGFSAGGKGSLQGHNITPEMHSKQEREDMRQLAKINEVQLTTHANITNLGVSGFDNHEGFKDAVREKNLTEVKRAIDFAADVAGGGPVVFHLGEFQRPIHGIEKDERFEMYPKEKEEKSYPLVDSKTGRLIMAIKEDQEIYMPEYETDKDGKPVPKLNTEGEPITYDDLVTEEKKPLYRHAVHKEGEKKGNIIVNKKTYSDYYKEKMEELKKGNAKFKEELIPKMFYAEFMRADIEQNAGSADEYEVMYDETKRIADRLQKELTHVRELEKNMTKEEINKMKQELADRHGLGLEPFEELTPSEYLKRNIWELNKKMAYGMEIATAARKKIAQTEEDIKHIKPAEEEVLKKSADSLARLGLYAMDKEKKSKELGTYQKPLFVAPENLMPELYGGHPDEYKKIIQNARKEMAKMLVEKGTSKGKAEELASEHIKATFDIGHAHTWKKYFKGPDEEFNKWMIGKVKDLAKEGIIGHVHITDNFGYEDEHLGPGEGTAPIGAFVKEMRKSGYKGPMILEPGAQERSIDILRTAMRSFNSPIYRIDGASVSWADVEHGYFGKTRGPTYTVGAYAPDISLPTEHRTWTFWSGVPME